MRIKEKINQSRRDFKAVYECEHCGHEEIDRGYDDHYFHEKVIPEMVCKKCGKKADPKSPTSTPDVPAHLHL